MPAPDGPAIGSGDPDSCFALDQRDRPRPSGAGCDLGAVEYQAAPTTSLVVTNTADTGAGSLRQAVITASSYDDDAFSITFAPQVSGTLTLTSGQIDITRSMTITRPGPDLLTLSGAGAHRLFQIGAGIDEAQDIFCRNGFQVRHRDCHAR